MKINLNNSDEFTLANVRQLISSEDVKKATHVRVSWRGWVYLEPVDEGNDVDDVAFQFRPWLPEDRKIGPEAAADDNWVLRVYEVLRENWPHPSAQLIDTRQ